MRRWVALVLGTLVLVGGVEAQDAPEPTRSRATGRVGSRGVERPSREDSPPPPALREEEPVTESAEREEGAMDPVDGGVEREPTTSEDPSAVAPTLRAPPSSPSEPPAAVDPAPPSSAEVPSPAPERSAPAEIAPAERSTPEPSAERSTPEAPAERVSPRAEPVFPTFFPVPVPNADQGASRPSEFLRRLVPMLPEEAVASTFGLVALVLLALLGTALVQRTRDVLPATGVVPRTLAAFHFALRLLVLFTVLALVARLLPSWIGPALPWVLLAAAAALGWSTRDLLPDFVAGLVLLLERKLRRGVWVATDGCAGKIERIGLRATWLRDSRGFRVAVPNRRLLVAPVASVSAVGVEHEVSLRIATEVPAAKIRQALFDAVLLSPWVPPDASPMISRDTDQPSTWRVRSRLLDMNYAARFEGSLLERTEEILEGLSAAAPSADRASASE